LYSLTKITMMKLPSKKTALYVSPAIITILLVLILCNVSAQIKPKKIKEGAEAKVVTGFAHGFKDSTWLYFKEVTKQGTAAEEMIDSSIVINERFSFHCKTPLTKSPRYFTVRTKTWSDYKYVWIEDKPIVFSGVKGNFRNALIDGSVSQKLMEQFERLTFPLVMEIDSLNRYYGNTDPVIFEKIKSLQKLLVEKSGKFIEDNASAFISVNLLSVYCKEWGKSKSKYLFAKLSKENKATAFGKKIETFIKLNQEITIGSQSADIKLPAPDGKILSLSDYRGKYILLEFWASWCGPCRRENPNLVQTYNEFKDKGFEIFGVSCDANEADWKKAIEKDGLIWPQVSELKGGEDSASLIYGVFEIPTNYLIDRQGKIIAKNLRGENLTNKIKELLK
jgi:peroxiredoxin